MTRMWRMSKAYVTASADLNAAHLKALSTRQRYDDLAERLAKKLEDIAGLKNAIRSESMEYDQSLFDMGQAKKHWQDVLKNDPGEITE